MIPDAPRTTGSPLFLTGVEVEGCADDEGSFWSVTEPVMAIVSLVEELKVRN